MAAVDGGDRALRDAQHAQLGGRSRMADLAFGLGDLRGMLLGVAAEAGGERLQHLRARDPPRLARVRRQGQRLVDRLLGHAPLAGTDGVPAADDQHPGQRRQPSLLAQTVARSIEQPGALLVLADDVRRVAQQAPAIGVVDLRLVDLAQTVEQILSVLDGRCLGEDGDDAGVVACDRHVPGRGDQRTTGRRPRIAPPAAQRGVRQEPQREVDVRRSERLTRVCDAFAREARISRERVVERELHEPDARLFDGRDVRGAERGEASARPFVLADLRRQLGGVEQARVLLGGGFQAHRRVLEVAHRQRGGSAALCVTSRRPELAAELVVAPRRRPGPVP